MFKRLHKINDNLALIEKYQAYRNALNRLLRFGKRNCIGICLESKCREIVESKMEDGQCGFRPSRSTTDQIFILRQIVEKSCEFAKDVFACFVDLEKAYNRVSHDKLWRVLQEYGIDGHLLMVIKSLYRQPEVCIRESGKQSKSFYVGVGLRQGCVLSPLLFIIYVNWID